MGDALSPLVTLSKVLLCAIRQGVPTQLPALQYLQPAACPVACPAIPCSPLLALCSSDASSGMTLTLTNLADINIDIDIDNYIDKSGWLPLTMTAYSSGHVSCV